MKMKIVDIRINDIWKFSQVAFLVDRDDFLSDIHKAREYLHVPDDLVPLDQIDNWLGKTDLIERTSEEGKKQSVFVQRYPETEQTINYMLHKYKKGQLYKSVIRNAILTGIITDKELPNRSVHLTIVDPEDYARNLIAGIPQVSEIAMILSPETELKDVTEVFQKNFGSALKELRNRRTGRNDQAHDVISNIDRDRKWYWAHKEGKSYKVIAKDSLPGSILEKYMQKNIDKIELLAETVRKAVKQYESRLISPIA